MNLIGESCKLVVMSRNYENSRTYITNEEVDEEARNGYNNELLSGIKIMFRTGSSIWSN